MNEKRLCWLSTAVLAGFLLLGLTRTALQRTAQAATPPRRAAQAGDVVINEIAWAGHVGLSGDEWIELHNTTAAAITLSGWRLYSGDSGGPDLSLDGTIPAGGYYLIERGDDETVSDILADWSGSFGNGLSNAGEVLTLTDALSEVIDTANGDGGGWPAGTASPDYCTMERVTPLAAGTMSNWASNDGVTRNGLDANGQPINGTPGARNAAIPSDVDLILHKHGPAAAAPGDAITYTLQLGNAGLLTATGVRLTDTLPTAVRFITASLAPDLVGGRRLTWALGDLPGGEASTMWLTITARALTGTSGAATNIATATTTAGEPLQSNNVATWTVQVVSPTNPLAVVINEVAWAGNLGLSSDEWIELYNNTTAPLPLDGWTLHTNDGTPQITLSGTLPAQGYYLLERDDEQTVADRAADQIYQGALVNSGERITLTDGLGTVVDTANGDGGGWPAGCGAPDYCTMERVDPTQPDTDANWAEHDGITHLALDANGQPINGTPGARNSAYAVTPVEWANLVLAKSGPPTVALGGRLTYTLRLSNTGALTASAVRLTDTLPTGVTFLDYQGTLALGQAGASLYWTADTLPPGGALQLQVNAQLSATGLLEVINVVTVTTITSETETSDNVARWTTRVAGQGDVCITAVCYDGYQSGDSDEAVQIFNAGASPVNLAGWELANADRGTKLPDYVLPPGQFIWIARDRAGFAASFGHSPDLDVDDLAGSWPGFANGENANQDEVILRDPQGQLMDVLIYETGDASVGGWVGPALQPYPLGAASGQILYRVRDEVTGRPWAGRGQDSAADWAQYPGDPLYGRRVRYPGWQEALFWPLTATEHASLTLAVAPEASYDLLYEAITRATRRIDVSSYTLEHARLAEALAHKAAQGISVTVLLEGEPAGGLQDQERWACQQIEAAGGACWFMHNYAKERIYDRYDHLHAKYLLIDEGWLLVGTENLNPTGLPDDDKRDGTAGRRGLYLMTNAPTVVARASAIFAADLDPAHHRDLFRWQDAPYVSGSGVPTDTFGRPPLGFTPVYTSGGITYTARFSAPLKLSGRFTFELFTAPEAALRQRDALLGLLGQAGAGDELYVEMLYERAHWGMLDGEDPASAPNPRLVAYLDAARRGARVRVLLDRRFDTSGASWSNAETVQTLNRVAQDEGLDLQARRGDPTGGGLHNKLVLVRIDGQGTVHMGSLNGSEASSKINRELALQVQADEAYDYLKTVFDWDWHMAAPLHLPLIIRHWAAPASPVDYVLISEVLYNPIGAGDSDEWVELYNPTAQAIDLTGWYLGDVSPAGEFGSGLYTFPPGTRMPAGGILIITRQASDVVGVTPDLEFLVDPLRDDPDVPNMCPAGDWEGFGFALGNAGDEVLLLAPDGTPVDVLTYGAGHYPGVVPHPGVSAAGHSLERRPAIYDSDDCSQDFFDRYPPDPGAVSPY